MPLVNMRDMLQHAYQNGYAVGAFGLANFEFLEAIMLAAENCRAPVILNLSSGFHNDSSVALVLPSVEAAAKRATVPVAIHYDHAQTLDATLQAIKLGSNGVMLNSSSLPLDQNIQHTRTMVQLARSCGIAVEGDLGYSADEADGNTTMTTISEARVFVERTEVDFLAVSVGNHHGQSKSRLDYTRLKQINAVVDCPLVIHGGSGLSEDQLRRLLGFGVAKINYFTTLADLAGASIHTHAKENPEANYFTLKSDVRDVVCRQVESCMRIFGSAGRAAEVLTRCQSWLPVEQILLFKAEPHPDYSPEVLMHEAKVAFSQILGVREVFCGELMNAKAHYPYCLRLQLAHPVVLEHYQQHPAYKQFSERYARPVVGERLLLDYKPISEYTGR